MTRGKFPTFQDVGTNGQVLTADDTAILGYKWETADLFRTKVELTSSGNWTVPAGVNRVAVICISGGQGGGGGATATTGTATGGGGGWSGIVVSNFAYDVTPGASIAYTIGAGGSGGASRVSTGNANGNPGALGTATTFGNISTGSILVTAAAFPLTADGESGSFQLLTNRGLEDNERPVALIPFPPVGTANAFSTVLPSATPQYLTASTNSSSNPGFVNIINATGALGTAGTSPRNGGVSDAGFVGSGANGGSASGSTVQRTGGTGKYGGGGGGGGNYAALDQASTATAGGAGGANTGGGGGGGGAATAPGVGTKTSGAGGNGGSGIILVFY